jgi:large subunit ribosomal protein L10
LDRRTKEQVAVELHEKVKSFKLAALANFNGMDVAKMTALRNDLRKSNAELKVVKNTLLSIASRDTSLEALQSNFKGPLALILSYGDPVEPSKIINDFAKKNAELELKIGILGDKVITVEQLSALAELPNREVLLAKLLSVMVGVQTQLVNVLSAVPRGLVQVLDGYRAKKEENN